jgi:outer membrane receptor protein involved in Fe transport
MKLVNFSVGFRRGLSIALLIGMSFTLNLLAQGGFSISGIVKDINDAVVPDASVTVTNTVSGRQLNAVTGQDGKYEFKDLPAGIYRVTIRKRGFSDVGETIKIDSNVTQDFTLSLGSLREEVTVTATRSLQATADIPQTVTVATEADIEQRRPVSISETFERSPSVLSTDPNPFRARPQIRGLQSNRILVTVDGERLNNPRFGADFVGVSPNLLDTSQIKSVEVIAGSASSLYGSDAVGGTVNIITKGPERSKDGIRFDFRSDGDYGSNKNYRKGSVNLGIGSNRAAVRLNLGRFIQPNYNLGGESVSRQEVLTFGQFSAAAGNLVGQSIISAYPVYEIQSGQEVPNSQARGLFGAIDFMLFPTDNQSFRMRYSNNAYRDLGVPWTIVPYSTNRPNTGFSFFQKLRLVYEWKDITSWFPRFQASFYEQDYRRSLDEIRSNINAGSSYVSSGPPTFTNVFTGNLSTYTKTGDSKTINHNTGRGFDVQLNFLPVKQLIYITGVNYARDYSRDTFSSRSFNSVGQITSVIEDVRNTPNTVYENIGWYNQIDLNPSKYVRFSGGFRFDNWKTQARPTRNFPSGSVGLIFLRALPLIQANPGAIDAAGAAGYQNLANGQAIETDSNVVTYNIGATFFIPGGINPYIRYSTSFREPDLLARYLFRNFTTSPVFSLPSIINTNLRPEKGKDIDVGIKVSRQKYRGTFAYYRNEIEDATGTVLGSYCINPFVPTPIPGIVPTPAGFGCATGLHLVQIFQTVNFSTVLIRGFEAQGEADISLGKAGSFTPFFTFSTIKATNENPDANRRTIVQNLYNSNAPLELEGSVDDVPFYSLPNYQGSFAPRFTSSNGRWWMEYEYRFTSKITRVDPNEISFAGTTTYANFASYKGLKKHSIRGGVRVFEGEGDFKPTLTVTFGIENFTNNLYFQLFQPAPAPGRSFTVGATINFSKLFR